MTATVDISVLTLPRSFETIIRPLMPQLLAYFVRRVSPSADAADCLSETLVVLWRHRNELPREDADLRAWSFGIARNVLGNHQRSQVRHSRLAARLREDFTFRPGVVEVDDELERAMATLSDRDRELILLVVWDGFGVGEAGKILGLKAEAARARYSRARRALRELLS